MNTSLPRLIDLIKEGSYPSSQGIGLVGDGTKQKADRDKIAHFLWSVPAFDGMSSSQIGAMLDDVYAEWETLKPQYQDNIDKYIDYLDNTGGLQAFLREVKTMKLKSLLNEGTYSPQQIQAVNKMLPVLQQQLKTVETFRMELDKMSKDDRRFAGYTELAQNIWNTTNAMIGDLKSQVIQGKV